MTYERHNEILEQTMIIAPLITFSLATFIVAVIIIVIKLSK
jgi:hypothetical protein